MYMSFGSKFPRGNKVSLKHLFPLSLHWFSWIFPAENGGFRGWFLLWLKPWGMICWEVACWLWTIFQINQKNKHYITWSVKNNILTFQTWTFCSLWLLQCLWCNGNLLEQVNDGNSMCQAIWNHGFFKSPRIHPVQEGFNRAVLSTLAIPLNVDKIWIWNPFFGVCLLALFLPMTSRFSGTRDVSKTIFSVANIFITMEHACSTEACCYTYGRKRVPLHVLTL